MSSVDAAYSGSIPALYDRCLGPMLFEPYALDLAARAAALLPRQVCETAAGTGILTDALRRALPEAKIVATDLNQAMLHVAASRVRSPNVSFAEADAMSLPFETSTFDLVICQYGAMFFPDRVAGYRQARRVLKPGGYFLFNVWDSLELNPLAAAAAEALSKMFPNRPPGWLKRVPYGYHDQQRIQLELRDAGFTEISIETVAKRSRGSPRAAAEGLCLGTPLRAEIEEQAPERLKDAVATVAAALAMLGTEHAVDLPMSAQVFAARAC